MSTDAAMPVDGGGGAPAPAPATDSGEMTAAERAYFQSRGEDVAGLIGSTLLDPTNFLGAGEAKTAGRAAATAGRELAAEPAWKNSL